MKTLTRVQKTVKQLPPLHVNLQGQDSVHQPILPSVYPAPCFCVQLHHIFGGQYRMKMSAAHNKAPCGRLSWQLTHTQTSDIPAVPRCTIKWAPEKPWVCSLQFITTSLQRSGTSMFFSATLSPHQAAQASTKCHTRGERISRVVTQSATIQAVLPRVVVPLVRRLQLGTPT